MEKESRRKWGQRALGLPKRGGEKEEGKGARKEHERSVKGARKEHERSMPRTKGTWAKERDLSDDCRSVARHVL